MRFCHCTNHDVYLTRALAVPIFCCGKYQFLPRTLNVCVPCSHNAEKHIIQVKSSCLFFCGEKVQDFKTEGQENINILEVGKVS